MLKINQAIIAGFTLCILIGFSGCAATGPLLAEEIQANCAPDTSDFGVLIDGTRTAACSVSVPAGSFAMFRKVTVTAAVSGGRLVSLSLDRPQALSEDPRFKELGEKIVLQQNLDVDAVSGVSFSSAAFLKAVDRAVRP